MKPNVFLSGRNLPNVHVMPYSDVSTYHILWSDVVLIEAGALGQTLEPVASETATRAGAKRRVRDGGSVAERRAQGREARARKADGEDSAAKTAAKKAAAKKAPRSKPAAKKTAAKKSAAKKSTEEEGEVTDADASSHDRAPDHHREASSVAYQDRGEYHFEVHPDANKLEIRAGDRDAVRRQGDRSVDVEPSRQGQARWGRASGASRTGSGRS